MKPFQVFSAVLGLGLLLGACNTSSSQPIVTPPSVTQPPTTQPPVIPPAPEAPASTKAYEPNNTWDKAAPLVYGTPSSEAAIAGSVEDVDWYKFEGDKGDKLEILVRTQGKYAASTLDSYLELYPPFFAQNRPDLTGAIAGNDDGTSLEDGDFGSKISYTLTAKATYYLKVSNAREIPAQNSNVYDVLVSKIVAPK